MNPADNLLDLLNTQLDSLNRSERKVAQVILNDPQEATGLSIATLAERSAVSEPTVNRLCRTFGVKGFPDFKIRLAQSMARGTPYISQNVDIDDTAEVYTDKIFSSSIASLDATRRKVNPAMVEKAVDFLSQAQQILFFGMGASGAVAQDAQHKFFRFNIPVVAHNDPLLMRMQAAACRRGDVVVLLSFTGRTKETIEIAHLARQAGAVTIAVTAPGSPLSEAVSMALEIVAPEDTDVYMPMQSRLIQLTLLDVLATGVILRRGEDFQDHLRGIKQSLVDTRLAPQATEEC
ncbi:MAG TPA: transcriptional regulator HexR [Oceanospirillaceae bacterium]|nr:transcriptional regulator HexR [Oceanospirillaceae bacterium]